MQGQTAETLASLREAVSQGGEPARALLRNDNRFGRFRQSPQFQALIQQSAPMNLDLNL